MTKQRCLSPQLIRYRIARLVLAGGMSHIHVAATASQAHDLGYTMVIPHETSCASSEGLHKQVLKSVLPSYAWVKPLGATLEHFDRRIGLIEKVKDFGEGASEGDAARMGAALHDTLVVEGMMEGAWCRWGKEEYLGRVAWFSERLTSESFEVLGVKLHGETAEVDSVFKTPAGEFHDRTSWWRGESGWKMFHKSFQFVAPH